MTRWLSLVLLAFLLVTGCDQHEYDTTKLKAHYENIWRYYHDELLLVCQDFYNLRSKHYSVQHQFVELQARISAAEPSSVEEIDEPEACILAKMRSVPHATPDTMERESVSR